MIFTARIAHPNSRPPIRAYVHRTYNEVAGKTIVDAVLLLHQTCEHHRKRVYDYDFMLAVIWGDKLVENPGAITAFCYRIDRDKERVPIIRAIYLND